VDRGLLRPKDPPKCSKVTNLAQKLMIHAHLICFQNLLNAVSETSFNPLPQELIEDPFFNIPYNFEEKIFNKAYNFVEPTPRKRGSRKNSGI